MEYVPKINNFGLKMMVKSGLEKIFLKFLHAQSCQTLGTVLGKNLKLDLQN